MDFKDIRASSLKYWFYISALSIISYYKINKPTSNNLLQISSHEERDKITHDVLELWKEQLKTESPSFAKVIIAYFKGQYVLILIVMCISFLLLISETIIVYYLILYIEEDGKETTEGLLLVLGLILNTFFAVLLFTNSNLSIFMLGFEIKKVLIDIISEKALKVHSSVISKDDNRGKMLNTVTSDLSIFDEITLIVMANSSILTVIVSLVAVQIYFGVWGVVGLIVSLFHLPIMMYVQYFGSDYRFQKSKISDYRVKLIENLIEGIKIIKLYSWEIPYLNKIFETRKKESALDRRIISVNSAFIVLCSGGVGLILFISMSLHTEFGNGLEFSEVFFFISMLIFTQAYAISISTIGIRVVFTVQVILKRIEELLLLKEFSPSLNPGGVPMIEIKQSKIFWSDSSLTNSASEASPLSSSRPFSLANLSFEVYPKELLLVVGSSGSGKTSLLMGLLGELFQKSHQFTVSGTVAYAAEDPWIISSTLKENITIGKEYDPLLYQETIKKCALESDIASLPHGDQSLIGDRGITLSGGQKARLGLARALYSRSDIYLLDDPLSAVDTEVGLHLFQTIKELAREKIVVLVTHQTHFISQANKVLVIDNGNQIFFGTPEELNKQSQIIDNINLSLSTKNKPLIESDTGDAFKEAFIKDESINECELTYKTFWKYTLLSHSSVTLILLVLLLMILGQLSFYVPQYWCMLWVDSDDSDSSFYITGMAILVVLTYILYSFKVFSFNHLLVSSNEKLHNNALQGLTRTDASYFDTNDTGALITRFCTDVGYLDESIIWWYFSVLSTTLLLVTTLILQIIILPYNSIVIPLWILLSYYLLHNFTPVVQKTKNLILVINGPFLSTYESMLSGIATIRTLALTSHFTRIIRENTLKSYRAAYAFEYLESFVQYYLMLSISVVVAVNSIAVILAEDLLSTEAAAFSFILSTLYLRVTRDLSIGIVRLQSYMTSTQRLLGFAELKAEGELSLLPDFKITKGCVVFANVCMRYRPDCMLALDNLSLSIEAGMKVGVIGRTGAGKSSILQVLFRLVNPEAGTVFIDGVDYMTLGLHDLRKQVSVIPQSSFLFSVSIRDNLDPFREHTDDEIFQVLNEVSLNLCTEEPSDLDTMIVGQQLNFSSGQKQLFCLARSILRRNKIVMMDEATSNIDNETDKLMQSIVREKFKDCTMITIAHRLRTVVCSDKIVVMENGACKEFGTPAELVSNEDSLFRNFVMNTGAEESQALIDLINSN